MRLDRFLAYTLNESRTDVKKHIRRGLVSVNNIIVTKENTHVDTALDEVRFNAELLVYTEFYYYVINKPTGYVCANEDRINPTIIEYTPEFIRHKLHTVGRLDKDTTGVLLLTNDGKLTHRLISPKSATKKIYIAHVDKALNSALIKHFADGFMINNEFKTLPATLEILSETIARVTVIEGKFHQIKRMFATFGYEVIALHRENFGGIIASDLEVGAYRELSVNELKLIKNIT